MKKIIILENIKNDILNDYKNGKSILYLTKKYPYKYDKIHSLIEENKIDVRKNDFNSTKYYCDNNIFNNIDSEEKAYWLGFIYADGCIENNGNGLMFSLALCEKDISHLEKFKKFLNSNHPIYLYNTNYKDNKCCKIVIRNKNFCESLINKGVIRNKTYSLKFPEFIKDDLISHFIRGFFDGDGCITYNIKNGLKKFEIKITATKEMSESIKKYIPHKSNKFSNLYKCGNPESNTYSLEYGGNIQSLNILRYMYKDSNIYLDRKYKKYLMLEEMYE